MTTRRTLDQGSRDRVRAGGGVLLRRHGDHLQVLLVHRPRYGDWSHPKGKCEDGEKYVDAALREVHEESGILPALGPRLSNVTYVLPDGRQKKVKYWVMFPAQGKGHIKRQPDEEVDDAIWVSPSTALELLTTLADRDLLREALQVVDA